MCGLLITEELTRSTRRSADRQTPLAKGGMTDIRGNYTIRLVAADGQGRARPRRCADTNGAQSSRPRGAPPHMGQRARTGYWHLENFSARIAVFAGVAQLVEQRIRNAKVEGSNPFTGTSQISARTPAYGLAFFVSCMTFSRASRTPLAMPSFAHLWLGRLRPTAAQPSLGTAHITLAGRHFPRPPR